MKRPLLLLLLALTDPPSALASRPLTTEDTGTIDSGHAELELSANAAERPDTKELAALAILGLGILPGLEARIESHALLVDPERGKVRGGSGDVLFGLKARLFGETRRRPAGLLGLTVDVPAGDEERGLGLGEAGVGGVGVVSKTILGTILTANLGYTAVPVDRDLDRWLVAGSIERPLRRWWVLAGEVVSQLPAEGGDSHVVRGGLVHFLSERLALDGAGGFGLTSDSARWTVTLGLTLGLF